MAKIKKSIFCFVVAVAIICTSVAGCSRKDENNPTSAAPSHKPVISANNYVAKSGENSVPLISRPKGTPIAEYTSYIHWLAINPGDDEFVPFSIWQDGKEVRGFYNAYDVETFEPISYHIPSGLDPQTYLFQNADPTRSYIVLATFSTEPDAQFYAFGACFTGENHTVGHTFQAEVLEAQDSYLLVKPTEGTAERSSADKIHVPLKDLETVPTVKAGDMVSVSYHGEIQETYPAQITNVFRVTVYEIVETIEGNLKTYYKNADGTWQVDGRIYQHRLEITGRMPNAKRDSTFVYLTNRPEIAFDQAWKAAGLSSTTSSYFPPEEAILVEMFVDIQSNPILSP